ncbi:MAG: DUF2541 domain-containing protein [Hyphomicrobiaceae bacterium]
MIGALALFAFGATSAANAQVEVTLAEETVGKILPDIDRIDTRSIPGRFSGIRVYSLDGSVVDIRKIDIKYADGSVFTEDRGRNIRLDAVDVRTRPIGPSNGVGREKFIDQIVMHYKAPIGQGQKARVRIVGLTSRSGARAVRPNGGSGGTPVSSAPTRPTSGVPVAVAPTIPKANTARPGTVTAGGDVLFGAQHVGFGIDRDVIKVGSEFGKFDKIRLRVLDNDIFINELRVVYSNGDPDVLAVAANVPANARTKWFTLKGDRFIREIQLVYKSRPGFRGQARIEVYGEYAEGWYGPGPTATAGGPIQVTGEAFKHAGNRGWLYLGGQQPLFFSIKKGLGYETDTVSVTRNWGFNRLRLDVKDRAITLNKLVIEYGDGTSDTIPVGQKVDSGLSYGPIGLKPKPIKDIKVSYRSRLLDAQAKGKGYAFVEFWAQ